MTYEEATKMTRYRYESAKDFVDPHWETSELREHREYVETLKMTLEALELISKYGGVEAVKEACEKQIPKKPVHILYSGKVEPFEEDMLWANCPNCKGELQLVEDSPCPSGPAGDGDEICYERYDVRDRCCPECGQRLDWSEEDDE